MPLTFIDIERKKSWRIGVFFIVLLFLYLCLTIVLVQTVFLFFPIQLIRSGVIFSAENLHYISILIIFSIIIASVHFYFSAADAVRSLMRHLEALPPDPDDGIHRRLSNIMQEIHILTGNKKMIDCYVIPSLSMNALAVEDIKGNSAIGITEGLLSRLTGPQLESVMAHEAYHILSGDCLETSVAASLFGMYASVLEKIRNLSEEEVLHPLFIPTWILLKLSQLFNMFVSREREYRADAGSVRMTRNPLAMAEALHLLSRNWRGIGHIGNGIEMLCIVNPQATELDESEGLWANLLSTHPPIRRRIEILLNMARVSISELDSRLNRETKPADTSETPGTPYYALDPKGQWQGPFSIKELILIPWLSPLSWLSEGNKGSVERAWRNSLFDNVFTERLSREYKETTNFQCPNCGQPLISTSYEKTQVYQCHFCGGILVENSKIPRIIARREKPCADRVKLLAKAVMRENQSVLTKRILKRVEKRKITLIACPKCKNSMLRTFYSLAYLIEIDRCTFCGLTWFDTDELEMLQCLIENQITARIEG